MQPDDSKKQGPGRFGPWLFTLPLLFLTAALLALSARLAINAGELMPPEEIADSVYKTYGLYGPAREGRTEAFRENLYLLQTPAAAALGSSRLSYIDGAVFEKPYVMAGAVNGIEGLDAAARRLFSQHAPSVLLLGIEPQWFHPAWRTDDPGTESAIGAMLTPLQFMLSGKLSAGDIRYILRRDTPDIGITALTTRGGYDRAGAHHDTGLLTGGPGADAAFARTLKMLGRGKRDFPRGDDISQERWARFESLVAFLREKGISVVILTPPVAPEIADAMAGKDGFAWRGKLGEKLSALARREGVSFFGFHDIRDIGGVSCEFLDGATPGATAWNRLLLRMAVETPELRAVLNLPRVGWHIRRHAGRASTNPDETDFLGLGCDKGLPATETG